MNRVNKSLFHTLSAGIMMLMFLVLATGALAAPGSREPLYIDFSKADPEGDFVWNGTVSGDVEGALETVLLEARSDGHILHVVFDWIITSDCPFTARLKGTLDTESGKVAMNGTVIKGCYRGAQVREKGQLVDPATSAFVGKILVMPAAN